ncbi:hypothetical protein [Paenibacillus eucommiae]|uniref:Uncharacterized protein n=1 Tax=Paenibacillus eucommiae TaxID=1355755 RepID=A0ABS4J8X5_9BACL|nr:hypothetical protein [Paenibacillus eucommiae]MBP1996255.1 hypothetical protein [Paenibacillus eucommiae]
MGIGVETLRELKISGVLQDDEAVERLLGEHEQSLRKHIEDKQQMLNNLERMRGHLLQTKKIQIEPRIVTKGSFTIIGLRWSDQQLSEGNGIPQVWERFLLRVMR